MLLHVPFQPQMQRGQRGSRRAARAPTLKGGRLQQVALQAGACPQAPHRDHGHETRESGRLCQLRTGGHERAQAAGSSGGPAIWLGRLMGDEHNSARACARPAQHSTLLKWQRSLALPGSENRQCIAATSPRIVQQCLSAFRQAAGERQGSCAAPQGLGGGSRQSLDPSSAIARAAAPPVPAAAHRRPAAATAACRCCANTGLAVQPVTTAHQQLAAAGAGSNGQAKKQRQAAAQEGTAQA